jgi:hypothetical protein
MVKHALNTQYVYNTVPYFMQFGSADFWPDSPQNHPKYSQFFSNILSVINILYNSTGSSKKGRCRGEDCLKRPKNSKKRQIAQSYNTAQFVQYIKIRVKYHTAYYTNTPYDPSLVKYLLDTATRIQDIGRNYIHGPTNPHYTFARYCH